MNFKFQALFKDDKRPRFNRFLDYTKYIFGVYTIGFENRDNTKLNWKSLNALGVIATIVFVMIMLTSLVFLTYIAYDKHIVNPEKIVYAVSGVGVAMPSLQKDSIKEMNQELSDYSEGKIEKEEMHKINIVWVPIILFLPIIGILVILHEFGHYIMCRNYGIKIKDYGVGALAVLSIPIIPLGFVNPDEKELNGAKTSHYLSVISCGVFFNLISGILFFGLFILFPYSTFLQYLFSFNISIFMINSLPLAVLDGGLFMKKLNIKASYVSTIYSIAILLLVMI